LPTVDRRFGEVGQRLVESIVGHQTRGEGDRVVAPISGSGTPITYWVMPLIRTPRPASMASMLSSPEQVSGRTNGAVDV
jgi:hypothetical protein